jgi:hypothetical protein
MSKTKYAVAVVLSWQFGVPVLGQSPHPCAVQGRIVDSSGGVLPGAIITAGATAPPAISGAVGTFFLAELPAGERQLTV